MYKKDPWAKIKKKNSEFVVICNFTTLKPLLFSFMGLNHKLKLNSAV